MSSAGIYTVVFRKAVMGIHATLDSLIGTYRELFLISTGGRKTWLCRLVRWEQYSEIIF
jgi:hypothetical protein